MKTVPHRAPTFVSAGRKQEGVDATPPALGTRYRVACSLASRFTTPPPVGTGRVAELEGEVTRLRGEVAALRSALDDVWRNVSHDGEIMPLKRDILLKPISDALSTNAGQRESAVIAAAVALRQAEPETAGQYPPDDEWSDRRLSPIGRRR